MWRVPDEDDIAATLSTDEADAYSQSAGFSADVVRRLVERTCDYVRDALRSNGKVRMSPLPFEIPSGTVSKAMDYLVVDLLKRFSLQVSEPRQKARESAEAYFAKIAAGEITPESYGSDGTEATSGPAIEVVSETRPRVTAAKLEGL